MTGDIPQAASAPFALTCGDPAGIGPEIILRWLAENPGEAAGVTAIGPAAWCAQLPCASRPVGPANFRLNTGEPSEDGARVALEAMEEAADGCREGRYAAVVTSPVSKVWLARAGYGFPGQTEFFAARWGGEPVMAFAGGRLRVTLATWHIPLAEVPRALTSDCLARAAGAASDLARAYGKKQPRIGVCGLNPHAGENGLLGRDEQERLDPMLARLRERYPGLSDCQPGDTVFHRALTGEFDGVIALYHDQGLAPLKTLEFEQSVNVTLGLPHIRTSPDHGTAFDIAGKGLAKHTSLANAVALARRLYRSRGSR